jgi:hypothetical protein
MFRENSGHLQENLFGTTSHLSKQQRKRLEKSKEYFLYEHFFSQIDEKLFEPLYFDNNGRPNAAINALVTATMLQSHNGWSVEFLIDQINFNLLTRTALGMKTIDGTPFCEATFYNFQNRMRQHEELTGENLLETQFKKLTAKQLKNLELKTGIQRTDSFQVMTNIKSRSRVELIIEVLIRLYRVLPLSLQEQVCELVAPYLEESSQQYIYHLEKSDIPHALTTLGSVYHALHEALKFELKDVQEFKTFARVYSEQFEIIEEKVAVRAAETVGSGSLQSADDLDATYRKKREKAHKGMVAVVTETAAPENALQLITDVVVDKNNVDDAALLEGRMDDLKAITEDLRELHIDGGFGSEALDKRSAELEIEIIQTAVKGREAAVDFEITYNNESGKFEVSCPFQTVEASKARARMKAEFAEKHCSQCPFSEKCPAQKGKKHRTFRFSEEKIAAEKRKRNIQKIPPQRRTLRANVEATVKEFSKGFNQRGKIKTRGIFKAARYVIAAALAINIGRIYRHQIRLTA